LIGLRNAVQVARIVTFSAQHNQFSRGTHYRADSLPAENQPTEMSPSVMGR